MLYSCDLIVWRQPKKLHSFCFPFDPDSWHYDSCHTWKCLLCLANLLGGLRITHTRCAHRSVCRRNPGAVRTQGGLAAKMACAIRSLVMGVLLAFWSGRGQTPAPKNEKRTRRKRQAHYFSHVIYGNSMYFDRGSAHCPQPRPAYRHGREG